MISFAWLTFHMYPAAWSFDILVIFLTAWYIVFTCASVDQNASSPRSLIAASSFVVLLCLPSTSIIPSPLNFSGIRLFWTSRLVSIEATPNFLPTCSAYDFFWTAVRLRIWFIILFKNALLYLMLISSILWAGDIYLLIPYADAASSIMYLDICSFTSLSFMSPSISGHITSSRSYNIFSSFSLFNAL